MFWPMMVGWWFRVIRSTSESVHRRRVEKRLGRPLGLVLALLLAWVGCSGCGVKAPPVPLRQPAPLPAVTDLAYRVADHAVVLTWTLSPPLDNKTARQASFIVRRSRTALDAVACENCPRVFEKVGTVPYVEADEKPFTLRLALEAGNRYVFTVRLRMDGVVGPDSNPAKFDYPLDEFGVPMEEP